MQSQIDLWQIGKVEDHIEFNEKFKMISKMLLEAYIYCLNYNILDLQSEIIDWSFKIYNQQIITNGKDEITIVISSFLK